MLLFRKLHSKRFMSTLKNLHNSVNGDDDDFQLNLNFISSSNEELNRIFFFRRRGFESY